MDQHTNYTVNPSFTFGVILFTRLPELCWPQNDLWPIAEKNMVLLLNKVDPHIKSEVYPSFYDLELKSYKQAKFRHPGAHGCTQTSPLPPQRFLLPKARNQTHPSHQQQKTEKQSTHYKSKFLNQWVIFLLTINGNDLCLFLLNEYPRQAFGTKHSPAWIWVWLTFRLLQPSWAGHPSSWTETVKILGGNVVEICSVGGIKKRKEVSWKS